MKGVMCLSGLLTLSIGIGGLGLSVIAGLILFGVLQSGKRRRRRAIEKMIAEGGN
jgi:hypothetical protein